LGTNRRDRKGAFGCFAADPQRKAIATPLADLAGRAIVSPPPTCWTALDWENRAE
jgi:hypothetical protein